MKSETRVLIAEDHRILREGLRALFSTKKNLNVVGEAGDGREAIRMVRDRQPDLVLLDISMPRTNGLDAIKEIKRLNSRIKIVILTVHKDEEYVMEALKNGADGYLLKDSGYDEILIALSKVMEGKKYLSPDISGKVVDGYLGVRKTGGEKTALGSLTSREKEIMKLIAEGYTNKQMAAYLCISPKTVEKHRANLMRKLGIHNIAELISLAVRKGIVST